MENRENEEDQGDEEGGETENENESHGSRSNRSNSPKSSKTDSKKLLTHRRSINSADGLESMEPPEEEVTETPQELGRGKRNRKQVVKEDMVHHDAALANKRS